MKQRTPLSTLSRHLLAAGLLGSAALLASLPAQAQMGGATVRGTITTAGARVAAGTEVRAINKANGNTYRTRTLADGSYALVGLSPGAYEIRIGEATQGQNIVVSVGETAELDLASGATDLGTVVVTGTAQRQGVMDSQIGTSISNKMIEAIPQATRNFLSAADFAPGVDFTTDASGNTRLRSLSANEDAVNIFIDGVGQKNNILRGGVVGQDTSQGNPFPQGAVAEYKVITQNYKAEYDQVASAAIDAVTKSGGNETHGEVYVNRTGANWTALSPIQKQNQANGIAVPDYSQVEDGFSIGGAIKKDVLHYFVAYDGKNIENPAQIAAGSGTLGHYTSVGLVPQLVADQLAFKQQFREHLLFGKLSAEIDEEQRFDISTTLRRETSYSIAGPQDTVSTAINNRNTQSRVDATYEISHGPWLNEAHAGWETADWNPQSDSSAPQVTYEYSSTNNINNIQEILQDGGSPNAQNRRQTDTYLKDDLSYTGLAGHVFKGGVQLKSFEYALGGTAFRVPAITTVLDTTTGQPYFTGTTCTGTNVSNTGLSSDQCRITLAIPSVDVNFHNNQFGAYFQDDWRANKQLELNLGMRWDYETNMLNNGYVTPADRVSALLGPDGRTINGIVAPAGQTYAQSLALGGVNIASYIADGHSRKPYKNAFAPRLGFSYDVLGDRATVFYGGWGRSYDRRMANNALDELQKNAQPNGEIWLINNHFKMPYADQFSVGIRQALADWNLDVAVSNIRAHNQFIWFGGNRDPRGGWGTQSVTDPLWGGPNGYGTLVLGDFVGANRSSSLLVKLEKPYTQASGWAVSAAFTYTDAQTTENGWNDDIFDWTYGKTTHGWNPTLYTEKARLVLGGMTDRLPWDLQLSGKFTYGSGLPRQITDCHLGFATNTTPGQCVYVERIGDAFKQMDVALAKSFKFGATNALTVRADVLNLFNTANWGYYDDWVGGPTATPANAFGGDNGHFNTRTGLRGSMRTFKLGASYSF
ncbi:MAG: TonB-dependent receptor [Pelomonas sp.]|nr:TonB-dependent receptor [Roseateles sp.]